MTHDSLKGGVWQEARERFSRYFFACVVGAVFSIGTAALLSIGRDGFAEVGFLLGLLALGMSTASVVYQTSRPIQE